MRRRRAIAVLALVALCSGGTNASAATSPAIVAVGWWTRVPGQTAPDGGMAVGNAPDGPASVAAIELDLGDGLTGAQLRLTEASGTLQAIASMLVCTTTASWQPVSGGPLADAPLPDCSTSAPMTRDGEGVWQADVGRLVQDRRGRVSLMVLPGRGDTPLPGVSLVYDLRFGAPELVATATPSVASSAPPVGDQSPPAVATPVSPSTATPPPSIAPPTTQPSVVLAAPSRPPTLAGSAAARRSPPWGQWLRIVVLATLAGVASGAGRWWFVSRPAATAP